MRGEQTPKQDKAYSVTGRPSRGQKPVSFGMPQLSKKATTVGVSSLKLSGLALIISLLVVSLLGGVGGALLVQNDQNESLASGNLSTQKKIVTSQSQLISQIAKTVGPSVVSVNVNITSQDSSGQGGYGLFGYSEPDNMQGAGTGIIISSDGLIVTNRHVVPAGTTNVSVTLSDGTELKNVTVVGRTNNSDSLDVAFLKIADTKGHKLVPAVIGNSSSVQVGDNVVAIGNALGQFQNTVTSGIISGYGRSVQASDGSGSAASAENLDDLFQTDAAINEGNSGGPLVNLNGQVIGINTAIAGNAQNIGFAIPINNVRGLIDQVLKKGEFARPYLGVRYIPLTADVASQYELSVQDGAFIAPSSASGSPSVIADGPADKAGLQEKDIIVEVDGKKIDEEHSLTSLLGSRQPGDKVKLTILRGDKTVHVDVTLGQAPASP